MKKILSLNLIFVLFMILSFGLHSFVSAQTDEHSINNIKLVHKTSRQNGWEIPTFDRKDIISTEQKNIQAQTVTVEKYILHNPIETNLEMYSLNGDGSLNVGYQESELSSALAYSLDGKVFAYRMTAVVIHKGENGSKIRVGIITPLYYSDEDGDGKFETRYIGDIDTKIPAWLAKPKN